MLDQPGWCVVMTKVMAEEVAERAIRETGYRTYLPRYRKIIRGTRIDDHGRRARPRGEIVMRPLFPGYLFAELHPGQGWNGIKKATGVADVLRYPGEMGEPKLMAAEIIDVIHDAELAGDFDEARPVKSGKRKDIKPGDTVQINAGPFAGLPAQLVALDEHGRAQLLVALFGRENETSIEDANTLSLVSA